MKSSFLLLSICILLACNSISQKNYLLNKKDYLQKKNYINFSIDTTIASGLIIDTIYIELIFENISNDSIIIPEPIDWGYNILPFLYDSNGMEAQHNIRIKRNINQKYRCLGVGEIYNTTFMLTLNRCYDLTKKGLYRLKFMYNGAILNTNREVIANKNPIYSNTIEIRLE